MHHVHIALRRPAGERQPVISGGGSYRDCLVAAWHAARLPGCEVVTVVIGPEDHRDRDRPALGRQVATLEQEYGR